VRALLQQLAAARASSAGAGAGAAGGARGRQEPEEEQQAPAHGSPKSPSSPGSGNSSLVNALVLHAPKRQVVEVWLPGSDVRLATLPAPGSCRLLSCGPYLGMLDAAGQRRQAARQQRRSSSTGGRQAALVLEASSGLVWDVGERVVGLIAA
jgi:hypothetical protein